MSSTQTQQEIDAHCDLFHGGFRVCDGNCAAAKPRKGGSPVTRTTCGKCYQASLSGDVYLCPLHGAAERMLAALERVLHVAFDGPPEPVPNDKWPTHKDWRDEIEAQARAAIKEARGE